MSERYARSPCTDADIELVWAVVTETPCAALRAIAHRIRLSHGTVGKALDILRMTGRIAFTADKPRERTVLRPSPHPAPPPRWVPPAVHAQDWRYSAPLSPADVICYIAEQVAEHGDDVRFVTAYAGDPEQPLAYMVMRQEGAL